MQHHCLGEITRVVTDWFSAPQNRPLPGSTMKGWSCSFNIPCGTISFHMPLIMMHYFPYLQVKGSLDITINWYSYKEACLKKLQLSKINAGKKTVTKHFISM